MATEQASKVEFLRSLCAEFSQRCGGQAIVAGGCIRDLLMDREPKDYDVFVCGAGINKSFRKGWAAELQTVDSPDWHKSEPNLQATFRIDGKIVQVMKSERAGADDVVDQFDWNVSRFAFDPSRPDPFLKLTSLEDIGDGKELALHRVTFPVSTLRRGFRFSERFGMQFKREDLLLLCVLASGRLLERKEAVK